MPATQLCTAAQRGLQQLKLNSCTLPKRLFPPLLFIPGLFNEKRKAWSAPANPLFAEFQRHSLVSGSGHRNLHNQDCFPSSSHAGLNLMSDLLYSDPLLSPMAVVTALLGFMWPQLTGQACLGGLLFSDSSPPDNTTIVVSAGQCTIGPWWIVACHCREASSGAS